MWRARRNQLTVVLSEDAAAQVPESAEVDHKLQKYADEASKIEKSCPPSCRDWAREIQKLASLLPPHLLPMEANGLRRILCLLATAMEACSLMDFTERGAGEVRAKSIAVSCHFDQKHNLFGERC